MSEKSFSERVIAERKVIRGRVRVVQALAQEIGGVLGLPAGRLTFALGMLSALERAGFLSVSALFGDLRLGAALDAADRLCGTGLFRAALPGGGAADSTVPAALVARVAECWPEPHEQYQLGTLYQALFLEGDRNKAGAFVTPWTLACEMAAEALELAGGVRALSRLKILEPACGAGIFSLACLEAVGRLGMRGPEAGAFALGHLFGIDRDPFVVETARLALLVRVASLAGQTTLFPDAFLRSLAAHFVQGNALLDTAHFGPLEGDLAERLDARSWSEWLAASGAERGFDVIIGNPPYGLSRGEQLSPEENQRVQDIYADLRSNKPNKYLLFFERGLQLLHPKGTLSLVVPNSWLGIESGRKMREHLIETRDLSRINLLGARAFPDLGVETVVALVHRGRRHSCLEVVDEPYGAKARVRRIPHDIVTLHPERAIPVRWHPGIPRVIATIEAQSRPVAERPELFRPMIALQAYLAGKGTPPQTAEVVRTHPFHSRAKDSPEHYPYLHGGDIGRYKVSWSGEYLRHGPWLAECHPLERYMGARVLVREIVSTGRYLVTAAWVDELFLYNKSVLHVLQGPEGSPVLMRALAALLNSCFATFFFRQRGRKANRSLFPKLVVRDLQDFPIPYTLADAQEDLAGYEAALRQGASGDAVAQLQDELDCLVFDCYNLSEDDRRTIVADVEQKAPPLEEPAVCANGERADASQTRMSTGVVSD